MVLVRFETKDYAQSTLLVGISSGALSFQVQAGHGARFPAAFDYFLVLETISTNAYGVETVTAYEQVRVTNRSTDTFTVTRAQNGTAATAFLAGARVSLHVVSKIFEDMQDAIEALQTDYLSTASFNSSLRTNLTTWRLIYVNGSGDETAIALGTSGQVLSSNGTTSAPTWISPTVDINALTNDATPDKTADYIISYDASAGTNKKVLMSVLVPDASTATKGVVEKATVAEGIARADTDRYVTPEILGAITQFAILQTSRVANTADGTTVLPHGLTTTPKRCQANAHCVLTLTSADANTSFSVGYSDGTNNKCSYTGTEDSGGSPDNVSGNDATKAIRIVVYGATGESLQTGTIAFDATNVTITWDFTEDATASTQTIYVTLFVHA